MTDTERYRKTYRISWEQLHRDCKALAWRLVEMNKWEWIISIVRGGLIPAAIIARELEIHHVDTICVSSYTLKSQGELSILKNVSNIDSRGTNWLIIDDLVDTGKTARVVRNILPDAHFATVYAKPEGRPFVDTFITEVSQDTWILFPWDAEYHYDYVQPIIETRR
ncbi:MAG TPA: xanthine phosphoribosyltransferase [Synergistales bacterium]|nr:xanthine phosphoribosyltransferase [Synergistales bacterium]